MNNQETNDAFWDCECEVGYIHMKLIEDYCPICGCHMEDMPDSLQIEVVEAMGEWV